MTALFPALTPDREAALILLARERRKTRPNLAAWYNDHITLSRAHTAHNPDAAIPHSTLGAGEDSPPKTLGQSDTL